MLRILIVDDNRANRIVLRAALQALGHVVIEAVSAEHAISLVEQTEFSVIILDIEMPGMSGVDAFHIIRGLKGPNSASPILAYTAHEDRLDEFIKLGFNGAVSKPLDVTSLCTAVRAAVHHTDR